MRKLKGLVIVGPHDANESTDFVQVDGVKFWKLRKRKGDNVAIGFDEYTKVDQQPVRVGANHITYEGKMYVFQNYVVSLEIQELLYKYFEKDVECGGWLNTCSGIDILFYEFNHKNDYPFTWFKQELTKTVMTPVSLEEAKLLLKINEETSIRLGTQPLRQ